MIYREIPKGHTDQKTVKDRLIPEAVTMAVNETAPAETVSEISAKDTDKDSSVTQSADTTSGSKANGSLININTADKAELMTLSGIGEKKAVSIIEYRTENGPFSDISELALVSGIGKKTVESIAPYITI